MNGASDVTRLRWVALAVFVLSTAINYLDRTTLAQLAAPISDEFHLSNAQYGLVLTAFFIPYATMAPFAGWVIDNIGLSWAASLAVGLWSLAGIATGFSRGLTALVICRAILGLAEAGGIPAAAKAIHQYLRPAERSLGNALNQTGVSVGIIAATPLATALAVWKGWRSAFIVTGMLGLLWIPLWNWVARKVPVAALPKPPAGAGTALLTDSRLWTFIVANALSMVGYSLWTSWTPKYLMRVHHLSLVEVAWYTWIPPLCALLGGLTGGWLSLRLADRGIPALAARFRVCLLAGGISLLTALLPYAPDARWSCAGISLSFAAVAAFSVNMYSMPLDAFGGARAAFAVSFLTASAGGIAATISYPIGRVVDLYGYTPVTLVAAITPLAACVLLWGTRSIR
ncbi:MAG TPA: MFS transporter [Bryobacteraceae bacterium]|nr:MFS transporter [Bryobacteraceae bacterium]